MKNYIWWWWWYGQSCGHKTMLWLNTCKHILVKYKSMQTIIIMHTLVMLKWNAVVSEAWKLTHTLKKLTNFPIDVLNNLPKGVSQQLLPMRTYVSYFKLKLNNKYRVDVNILNCQGIYPGNRHSIHSRYLVSDKHEQVLSSVLSTLIDLKIRRANQNA